MRVHMNWWRQLHNFWRQGALVASSHIKSRSCMKSGLPVFLERWMCKFAEYVLLAPLCQKSTYKRRLQNILNYITNRRIVTFLHHYRTLCIIASESSFIRAEITSLEQQQASQLTNRVLISVSKFLAPADTQPKENDRLQK